MQSTPEMRVQCRSAIYFFHLTELISAVHYELGERLLVALSLLAAANGKLSRIFELDLV